VSQRGIITWAIAIVVLASYGQQVRADVPPAGLKQVSLSNAKAFHTPGTWLDVEDVRDVRRGIATSVAIDKVVEGFSAARFVAKLVKSVWSAAKHSAKKFVCATAKRELQQAAYDRIIGKGR